MSTTGDVRIRLTKNQKERLRNLSEGSGHKTLSDYCRSKFFEDDMSLHKKLNKILEILEEKNESR